MRTSSLPLVLLLTMALLFAQWMGVKHRIVHAGVVPAHMQFSLAPVTPAVPAGDLDLTHSCIAFDAATMADSLHTPPFLPLMPANAHVLSLWAAFLSWVAPPSLCFSSRAPPIR